jgi:CysZ protein
VGLVRGFLAPFRGGAFIARRRLWHYLVLPLLLNVALGVTLMILASRFWRAEGFVGEQLIKAPAVGWLILVVLTIASGVVLFLVAQPLLSALFSDRLSERIERELRGEAPAAPFLATAGRAVAHGLLKLVLYALAMLAALVLNIGAPGVGVILGVALAGLFIAYDGFDYPLSRRGASFGKKWAYLVTHPAQTIGFGAGATLLYLVPLAFLVAPPFVAAGATMVFVESEGEAKVKEPRKRDDEKGSQPAKTAAKTAEETAEETAGGTKPAQM